ncbi:DUF1934 domain-containing protein [Oceanobacillus rekensis]|uniref:DUF1934 domain-containing protein n=1 Tax=Oceanobacillus rekensis TaxID=937927 RepID=UPI000B42DAEC|nr:DUF1934 domain-containing protein [Oceanobacillus rekensis]
MDKIQKNVTIQLRTVIDDDGQKEYNDQKQSGNYFRKKELDVLIFEEKLDDGAIIKNLITIQQHKVSINRSGAVMMNQKFKAEKITENIYHHPHGKIHMETFTESIDYSRSEDSIEGSLGIHYTVKLNGQDKRKHTLELAYKEEENQ